MRQCGTDIESRELEQVGPHLCMQEQNCRATPNNGPGTHIHLIMKYMDRIVSAKITQTGTQIDFPAATLRFSRQRPRQRRWCATRILGASYISEEALK